MRIRQVKPDYWRDEKLAALRAEVREFYIGMWQEADDAGWLRWNVAEIALDLYGYQSRSRRERWVTERGAALTSIGRLHIYDCGHAFVPNLTKHQKFGGRPVYTVRDAHARECAPLRANALHGKEKVEVRVGEGKERKGNHFSMSKAVKVATSLGIPIPVDIDEAKRLVAAHPEVAA